MRAAPGDWVDGARRGWAYTVRPDRLGAEVGGLRVGEAAAGWLRQQRHDLAAWLAETAAMPGCPSPTLPDGGEPASGALRHLDAGLWSRFECDFLGLPDGDAAAASRADR